MSKQQNKVIFSHSNDFSVGQVYQGLELNWRTKIVEKIAWELGKHILYSVQDQVFMVCLRWQRESKNEDDLITCSYDDRIKIWKVKNKGCELKEKINKIIQKWLNDWKMVLKKDFGLHCLRINLYLGRYKNGKKGFWREIVQYFQEQQNSFAKIQTLMSFIKAAIAMVSEYFKVISSGSESSDPIFTCIKLFDGKIIKNCDCQIKEFFLQIITKLYLHLINIIKKCPQSMLHHYH